MWTMRGGLMLRLVGFKHLRPYIDIEDGDR